MLESSICCVVFYLKHGRYKKVTSTKSKRFRVSTTTRPQRKKEDDGVDYFFTTQDEFEKDVMDVSYIFRPIKIAPK